MEEMIFGTFEMKGLVLILLAAEKHCAVGALLFLRSVIERENVRGVCTVTRTSAWSELRIKCDGKCRVPRLLSDFIILHMKELTYSA